VAWALQPLPGKEKIVRPRFVLLSFLLVAVAAPAAALAAGGKQSRQKGAASRPSKPRKQEARLEPEVAKRDVVSFHDEIGRLAGVREKLSAVGLKLSKADYQRVVRLGNFMTYSVNANSADLADAFLQRINASRAFRSAGKEIAIEESQMVNFYPWQFTTYYPAGSPGAAQAVATLTARLFKPFYRDRDKFRLVLVNSSIFDGFEGQ